MGATRIRWAANPDGTRGKSWNPVAGCRQCGPGCDHCYAQQFAARLAAMSRADRRNGRDPGRKDKYEAVVDANGAWNGKIVYDAAALNHLERWRKPTTIFVASMSDLFNAEVSQEFLGRVFDAMVQNPRHRYILLTKRSQRIGPAMQTMGLRPRDIPNLWLGFSAENQGLFAQRAIFMRHLARAGWNTFVSIEPILRPIDCRFALGFLRWVVVGSETGPGARRADIEWVERIVEACGQAPVPCFVKQVGSVADVEIGKLPNNVRVRQWPEGLGSEVGGYMKRTGQVPRPLSDRGLRRR